MKVLSGNNNFSIFCKKNFFFLTSKYNFSVITGPNLKKLADDCGRLNLSQSYQMHIQNNNPNYGNNYNLNPNTFNSGYYCHPSS